MIKTKNRIIQDDFDIEKYRHLTEERKQLEDFSACNEIPLLWEKAKNYSVYDDSGNKFIDMTSGIFVANAGHSNSLIKKAIRNCLKDDLLFSFNYNTKIRIEFIKYLLSISPKYFNKVILMNSGSEATDTAYKLIKMWAKKNKKKYILTFRGSYHGRSLGSCLLSKGKEYSEWSGVKDDDVIFIDFPKENDKFESNMLPQANEIAAVFLEGYQGWSAEFYSKSYIQDLYKYAKKNNILIVFDCVQSGIYRTGKLYNYMHYEGVIPDIICVAKGISSSLPLAAVISRSDIIDIERDMDYSGTHSGNCLCLYAALANLKFLQDINFQEKLKKRIEVFVEIKKLEKYEIVRKVNVVGMVCGILFDTEEVATKIVYKCIENGILPVWTGKSSIKLGPPLIIPISAIKEAIDVIKKIIKEYNIKNVI
jgi:acetylornithine/succinyldiaminopimelate/putrescine aminotransferase